MRKMELTKEIISSVFATFLLVYLVALLSETLWQKSISIYLNLNYLLIIVIVLGILSVLFPKEEEKQAELSARKKILFSGIAGFAGFAIIFYKLNTYGFGLIISIIAGILIFLLSILVLEDEEQVKPKKYSFQYRQN